MVWFKEEGEEKETDLGLRLGEEGAERGRMRRLNRRRIDN